MRRGEITPELIELSKTAKSLGFLQDVEEGDWTYLETDAFGESLILVTAIHNKALCDKEFLILSFSRCLEWLKKNEYQCQSIYEHANLYLWTVNLIGERRVITEAKTHHEAIAKAAVKILEEVRCK